MSFLFVRGADGIRGSPESGGCGVVYKRRGRGGVGATGVAAVIGPETGGVGRGAGVRGPATAGRLPVVSGGAWSVRRRPPTGGGVLGRPAGRRSNGSSPAGSRPSRRRSARLCRGSVMAASLSGAGRSGTRGVTERGAGPLGRAGSAGGWTGGSVRRTLGLAVASDGPTSPNGAACLPTVRQASRDGGPCPGPSRSADAASRRASGAAAARGAGRRRGPPDGRSGR